MGTAAWAIFSAGIFMILIFSAVADASLNRPEWEKGNYWKYRTEIYSGAIGANNITSREEILGNKNITVNGTSYNTILVKVTPNKNYSIENTYYRSSDLAVVKLEFVGINMSVIYEPPYAKWKYPVEVGDTWEYHGNIIRQSPVNNKKEYLELNYECIGEENISVPAGNFHCYVIKEYTSDGKNYAFHYLSPEVGNEVEIDTYYNKEISSKKVLLSFSYLGKTVNGTVDNNASENSTGSSKTPGFGVVSLMFGMAVAIFSIRKNSRKP